MADQGDTGKRRPGRRPGQPKGSEPGALYAAALSKWPDEVACISRTELAKRIGCQPPYLSELLGPRMTSRATWKATLTLLGWATKIIKACGGDDKDVQRWTIYHNEVATYSVVGGDRPPTPPTPGQPRLIGGRTSHLTAPLPSLRPPPELPARPLFWWRRSRTGRVAAIEQAADSLARQIEAQAEAEDQQRRLRCPALPIRWRVTPTALKVMTGVSWTSLGVDEPVGLTGTFEDIARKFTRELPHHRLVILGESGAGKSTLAVRLVRDLARSRATHGPVPVVFDARTWNTERQELADWLASDLERRFRGLSWKVRLVSRERPTLARALVTSGVVLPIIDGLDAIGPTQRSNAIRELDSHAAALVVTGQPGPYGEAITQLGHGLSGAAVVELCPLSHEELLENLEPLGNAGWQEMLACLRNDPLGLGPLSQAMQTPLMIWLLRTRYRKTTADAGELCDRKRFPDRDDIEKQLLNLSFKRCGGVWCLSCGGLVGCVPGRWRGLGRR